MANQEHLDILKQGIYAWNRWRTQHPETRPDLSEADLSEADLSVIELRETDFYGTNHTFAVNLSGANLVLANLTGSYLSGANLVFGNLSGAVLNIADLSETNLSVANLSHAFLSFACLRHSNLTGANLTGANLSGADLSYANISGANCREANLTGCTVHGISAWNVQLEKTIQTDLIITSYTEATITIDNIEVAQFIYLLLNSQEIRDVIETITSKVVLILGSFTPERRIILDAIRDEIRKRNYTPVLFDFEKPVSRDFTETVRTLAHLARFIIADLTEPSSIPQELQAIIPDLAVPVQPLLLEAKREYSMFVDFRKYHWVLPVYMYKNQASLMASLQNEIIEPADKKARELAIEKAKRLERP